MRWRAAISVSHFDNTDLVLSYDLPYTIGPIITAHEARKRTEPMVHLHCLVSVKEQLYTITLQERWS